MSGERPRPLAFWRGRFPFRFSVWVAGLSAHSPDFP